MNYPFKNNTDRIDNINNIKLTDRLEWIFNSEIFCNCFYRFTMRTKIHSNEKKHKAYKKLSYKILIAKYVNLGDTLVNINNKHFTCRVSWLKSDKEWLNNFCKREIIRGFIKSIIFYIFATRYRFYILGRFSDNIIKSAMKIKYINSIILTILLLIT